MIRGRISEDGEAIIIPVAITDSAGRLWPLETVLDTGFVGDLSLPASAIRRLGLVRAGSLNFVLANGESARLRTYHARALWHDRLLDIEVTETGDIPLIGVRMLRGSRVTMDMVPGGEIAIEEVSPTQR